MSAHENYFQRPDFARYSKQLSEWIKLSELRGLEIGPLDKPLLPKAKYDVRYLDVFPKEKLVARCKPNPNRNEDQVVPLDFVIETEKFPRWPTSSLIMSSQVM